MSEKKDLQGELIKERNYPYMAINGEGFFQVCNTQNLIETENGKECTKLEFTRNGSFKIKLQGLTNSDNQVLLGFKTNPPQYHYPKQYIKNPHPYCKNDEEIHWSNATCTVKNSAKTLPYNNPNALRDNFFKEINYGKIAENILTPININDFRYGNNNPTTYIKFKMNLDPKGCIGCQGDVNDRAPDIAGYLQDCEETLVQYGDSVKILFEGKIDNSPIVPHIQNDSIVKISYSGKIGDQTIIPTVQQGDQLIISYVVKVNDVPVKPIVQNKDKLSISFEGKIDDIAFPGGTATNFNLTIGSNTFIDNFEEQLIGTLKGDNKTVVVKFPSDYQDRTLREKSAIFEVKVEEIYTLTPPFDSGSSEDHSFKVGSGEFNKDLEALMIGFKNGARKTIPFAYPTDYSRNPEYAGQNAVFEMVVKDIENLSTFDRGDAYDHEVRIGEGKFNSEIEKQLIGVNKGDTIYANYTFPAEYSRDSSLTGQEAVFKIKVSDILFLNPYHIGQCNSCKLQIGSGTFSKSFEKKLIDMRKGETKNFNITFPENYPSNYLANKDINFEVRILEIFPPKPEENRKYVAKKTNVLSIMTRDYSPFYVQPLEIYDSYGNKREIEFDFIKAWKNETTGDTRWNFEAFSPSKTRDQLKLMFPAEKLYANGQLYFTNGKLTHVSGNSEEINIRWNDGSYNSIKLYFGINQDFGGITEYPVIGYTGLTKIVTSEGRFANTHINKIVNDPNAVELDGSEAHKKNLVSFYVNPKGKLFIVYDDGSIFNAYTIPLKQNLVSEIISEGKIISSFSKIYNYFFGKENSEKGYIAFGYLEDLSSDYIYLIDEVKYEKKYKKYDSNILNIKNTGDERDLTIKGNGFFAIKCEGSGGNRIFLTKNFRLSDFRAFKNNDNCYLLGKNIQNDTDVATHNAHLVSKEFIKTLDKFHYQEYEKRYAPSTKISIGSVIIDASLPLIDEIEYHKHDSKTGDIKGLNSTKKLTIKDLDQHNQHLLNRSTTSETNYLYETIKYNATDERASMYRGRIKSQLDPISIEITDLKGNGHNIYLGFVKTSFVESHKNNHFHAEIWEKQSVNVLITHGEIVFKDNGALLSYDLDNLNKIKIPNKNKAIVSELDFFWGDLTGKRPDLTEDFEGIVLANATDLGISKKKDNSPKWIKKQPHADGYRPVKLDKFYLKNGFIFADYKLAPHHNKEDLKTFQIFIADVVEANELIEFPDHSPTYIANDLSGPIGFFLQGTPTKGEIISGSITIFADN